MNDKSTGKTEIRGQCLCGKVDITAQNPSNSVGACHCRMCRRWGGGPFMEIDCGVDVQFGGSDYISVFDSSDWAERGFCSNCGTHLFYRLKGSGQHMVPVGLFEESENLAFDMQVFIDEKPEYYSFSEKTKKLTGAEIFALYGSS